MCVCVCDMREHGGGVRMEEVTDNSPEMVERGGVVGVRISDKHSDGT